MKYPHLFTPITLKNGLTLKNRIVMAPMATNFADKEGRPTELQLAYYVERARNGVALIVTESNYVREDGKNGPTRMGLHDDIVIPAHRKLVEAVHAEGCKICAQIHHGGYTISPKITGKYPVSCSATPLSTRGDELVGIIPKKLRIEEIQELVKCYASAAVRAKQAGYDAVQIHAAHGYLINQFLSPRINKRQDLYGGTERNRARFLLQVCAEVREAVGPEFPITVRFSGEEIVDGGYSEEFIIQIIRMLKSYNISEVSISGGSYEEPERIVPPYWFPKGYYSGISHRIKERVDIPVSVVGRITTPDVAEAILDCGDADLVYLGRELVAFPSFVAAAEKGEPVKECIGCNNCFTVMVKGQPLTCAINPMIGRPSGPKATTVNKNVVVVGGGPAGLTAAVHASHQGYRVKLYEKQSQLGGKLKLAGSIISGKEEIYRLVSFLEQEARSLGVEIICNKEITEEFDFGNAYAVIWATGALENKINLPGLSKYWTAEDAIVKINNLGQRVIIIGGGLVGVELAEALAVRGKTVAIVEMQDDILIGYETPNKRGVIKKLCDLGIDFYVQSKVVEVTENHAIVMRKDSYESRIPYDDIVLAVGYRKDTELFNKLDKRGIKFFAIGDCSSPGKILSATQTAVEAIKEMSNQ